MPRSIITLTTDFGLADHFAGTMRGVILGILPTAEIVDITHQITPFEIAEAAFVIAQAYPYFPRNTVHLVVVDPGVGSARRPILVEAGGQYFIGPDNGVFGIIYAKETCQVRELTNSKYFLDNRSNTFHGRDIFAPAAAYLRKSLKPGPFGRLIEDYLKPPFPRPQRTGRRYWSGVVLKVDHFGNLITNYRLDEFPELQQRPFEMIAGMQPVREIASCYAECPPGELRLVEGSSGYLEVALHQGSAAKKLGCGVGAAVDLTVY